MYNTHRKYAKNHYYYKRTNLNESKNNKKSEENPLNIEDKYLKLLKVKWTKPSVLSNSVLQSIPLDKFNYSEKIDGVHTYLLIYDKKVYNVTNNDNLSSIYKIDESNIKEMKFSGDCIIETEFYKNIYYIFDVYYLNGVDYSKKFLKERLDSINNYLDELGSSFKLKKFYEIQDINELLEYIKNEKSPDGNDIDGIILQRIDKQYFQEENFEFYTYKFKPLHLNTVDFLLKYNNKFKHYELYLLGRYKQNYLNNMKKLPKEKDIYRLNSNFRRPIAHHKFINDYEKILIYFDSPFYPNLGIMKPEENWNKEDYSDNHIKEIDDLIKDMNQNPYYYNDTIVELSLTNDKKWVPLRVRKDKKEPNSYRVGLSNVSIIFDQIKPLNNIYFQRNITMSQDKLNIIHQINQTFRKFIIEKYINKYGKSGPNSYSSVIDLCGGRGADELNLFYNGVSNFFVIDRDTTALKRYFDRSFNIHNIQYEPLIKKDKYIRKPSWINLNFLNHNLDKDYENIMKDLNSRYEFRNKDIDIVLMNFAIHYLCDEEIKLIRLAEFVKEVLYKHGIFIITYFDGDEILKKVDNNIAKIGPFEIEIIKREKDITIAKMPLPTFKEGNDIYAEEPLVHGNFIKILERFFDKYEDYYVYDKCKEFINKIKGYEEFIDYYRLIKVGIYYPKINHHR